MQPHKYQTDTIIVGAGIAGISSAIELLDHGKSVIIFDRDTPEKMGGLAKESFGGMFFVDTPEQRKAKVNDSQELAFKDWCSFAEFQESDKWGKKWAKKYIFETTSEVYEWLKKHGITFFPVVHWVERGLFKPGNSVPRFHMVWGTGYDLMNKLNDVLLNHPNAQKLTILFHHNVQDLIHSDGKVTGVVGINEREESDFNATAESVILASGGIQGCFKTVRKNWPSDWGTPPKVLLNGSHKYATGTLHQQTKKIGGNVINLDKMWLYAAGVNHPNSDKPNHGLSLVPPKSALWVNSKGERFSPIPLITGFDTRFLVEQICKQKEQYSWQILNRKIALKELAVSGAEFNDNIRDKKRFRFIKSLLLGNHKLVDTLIQDCSDFIIANSIEELVSRMNALTETNHVSLSSLTDTIHGYDDTIRRGQKYHNDEQLRRIAYLRQYRGDKIRTCKFQPILDKKAMPLIAIREHILTRKSLGGIETDLHSRVLTSENTPIKGLFAVGEASGFGGGGSHGLRALEGTFLGTCVLTGREASKTIIKG